MPFEDDSINFAPASLRDRPAGYEVMRASLDVQELAMPRSAVARFFGLSPIPADSAGWFTGALGERVVGTRLARLGTEWTVLHALPVGSGDSDIDHVVIGPGGVFTINTKRHRGAKVTVYDRRIFVAGQKVDHLRNSRHEATRAESLLERALGRPVMVTPMLVFVAIGELKVQSRPRDVVVLTDARLVRWLQRRKRLLTPDEVAAVVRVAERGETWSTKPVAPVDPSVSARYAELQREDSAARTRRRIWGVLTLVVVLPVALYFLLQLITGMIVTILPG